MPTLLPVKARAATEAASPAPDWVGLWALSLGAISVTLASLAYFIGGESVAASFFLVAAAAVIAVARRAGTEPHDLDVN
jgi:hypothetical protein